MRKKIEDKILKEMISVVDPLYNLLLQFDRDQRHRIVKSVLILLEGLGGDSEKEEEDS